jgi:glycerate 2-kinase
MAAPPPGHDADAAAIWTAALAAVAPEALVARRLAVGAGGLSVDGRPLAALPRGGRLVVVGAGKAAGGLARGLATLLAAAPADVAVEGLLSVPEGCGVGVVDVAGRGHIEVRATRPLGSNLPTPTVVATTESILAQVAALDPADLAIALVTGGGSACLAMPRPGLPLGEKVAVTRFLTAAGADIRALNVVRQAASGVKGGGLARACRAGRLVVLVLSDIVGDPLELIASGPCLPVPPRAAAALDILDRFGAVAAGVAATLVRLLEQDRAALADRGTRLPSRALADADGVTDDVTPTVAATASWTTPHGCLVEHVLLGTNATAVDAAAVRARGLGYEVRLRHAATGPEETAADVGTRLAVEARELLATARREGRPRALIEGGEAVVRLPAGHGRGGRNQHTAATALAAVIRTDGTWPAGLVVASIGTDGEDGPTAAAGGCIDAGVAARVAAGRFDLEAAIARCDTHPLLAAAGGAVVTGPTGTNVADVRIVLARP